MDELPVCSTLLMGEANQDPISDSAFGSVYPLVMLVLVLLLSPSNVSSGQ